MKLYWKLKLKSVEYCDEELLRKFERYVNNSVHVSSVSFYKDSVYISKPEGHRDTKHMFVFRKIFNCNWENCGLYVELDDINEVISEQEDRIAFKNEIYNYNFFKGGYGYDYFKTEINCNMKPNYEESTANINDRFNLSSFRGEDILPRWNQYISEGHSYYINIYIDNIIIKEENRFMDTDYYKTPTCHIHYSLLFNYDRDIIVNASVDFDHEDDSYSLEDDSMIFINNEDKKVIIDKIMYAKQNNMKEIQVL